MTQGVRALVHPHRACERGGLGSASDSVLDALAQALRLDDTEAQRNRPSAPKPRHETVCVVIATAV